MPDHDKGRHPPPSQRLLGPLPIPSNPLDWSPIDRLILLACLVAIAPALFGSALIAALVLAPDYLHVSVAMALLLVYAVHFASQAAFLLIAWKKRRHSDHWPTFENLIIVGFVSNIMLTAYLSGTLFSTGLLLFFLGVNIASALASIDKIRLAYWSVFVILVLFAGVTLFTDAEHAPLFSRSLYTEDGAATMGWAIFEIVISFSLMAVLYLSILVIARWVQRENLYREMSSTDSLTLLANRRAFMERGAEELFRATRQSEQGPKSVACLLADLDHFKEINDRWGHDAGDSVLVRVAELLLQHTRPYDEVARYGGEEFAILMPDTTENQALEIAQRLCKVISEADIRIHEHTIRTTISIGVACCGGIRCYELQSLLNKADQALYDAKNHGRNQARLYRPGDHCDNPPS